MKKGFTLIELLAVIIILAILMVVAVPNVLSTLNDAKEKTFITQAQSIWKSAEQTFIVHSLTGEQKECYDLSNPLDLGSISNSISYVVRMNVQTGKVESIKVRDTNQNFEAEGVTTNGITVKVENSDEPLSCGNSGGSGGSGGGGTAYLDGTIPVAPKLGNMIPIKYDGTKWVYADKTKKWYDYANKEWANAVVLSSGVTKTIGDTISESEIDLWFVWVPRYEYKLPEESIGKGGTPKAIDIKFITSSKTTPTVGYSFHPGFAWDSNWSDGISEWKDGIWIGKFESTAPSTVSNTEQTIKIKPNTTSWRGSKIVNMYNSSVNLKTDYSLIGLDSHMTRYTEHTSVTYLTNSIYGRCSDYNACTEITSNPSSSYLTGGGDYKINVNQSTTGNVNGVYDLSGGAYDYVMGYLRGYICSAGFSTAPTDNKYVDIFQTNGTYGLTGITHINGQTSMNGVYKELVDGPTSSYMWYSDYTRSLVTDFPWYMMGGYQTSDAGLFACDYKEGMALEQSGFRVALINN